MKPLEPSNSPTLQCLSEASFWFPERTSIDSGWAEHAPFAFWVIDALRPQVVVELGTHKGYSFSAFCQAVRLLKLDTKCYAIDTWQGDEHAGHYGDDIYNEFEAYAANHYGAFSRLIRSTFDEALAHFSDESVDLLHIDGRHFYDDLVHDYTTWRKKLKQNAIVLFHDINVRERDFGVYRFWDELKSNHQHFEFLHGNGLGVLAIGSDLPEQIKSILNATLSANASTTIREIYSRLGRAIVHHNEVAQNRILTDKLGAMVGGIKERDVFIQERDATIAGLHERIGALEDGLRERGEMVIAERKKTIQAKQNDVVVDRLRSELAAQQDIIRAIQAALSESNALLGKAISDKNTSKSA